MLNTKIIIVGTVAVTAIVAALFAVTGDSSNGMPKRLLSDDTDAVEVEFNKYLAEHSKNYLTKEEYNARLGVFRGNYKTVVDHNSADGATFELELNRYADQTLDEFGKRFISLDDAASNDTESNSTDTSDDADLLGAPASVDWRSAGAVSPVKDQGSCRSCYAFSAAGSLEGIYKIRRGSLVELSPQHFVDCTRSQRNAGCNGGFMTYCFDYTNVGNKLMRHSDYPYVGKAQACQYNPSKGVISTVSYTNVPKGNPSALMTAVAQQPVSVGISGLCSTMMLYKGGIINTSCGTRLNHGVLIVGYGSANGQNYWIVKNSWGPAWGEQGFFRLGRDMSNGNGLCGINNLATYPNI